MKKLSRSKRWEAAAAKATEALEELVDLQAEYEAWYEGMPENLQQTVVGEMLEEITNLDLESALDSANEAEGTALPRGFGRD
jgi:hypothetical protein